MARILQIFRDGKRFKPIEQQKLLDGYQGNLQTLGIMSRMVREDRTQKDLRRFIERNILKDVKGQNFDKEIKRIFEFCRDEILYRKDPVQVERIADLWSCLYALNENQAEGDCSIKSVALATMLAIFGHKPCFAIVKAEKDDLNFSHVFVEVEIDGEFYALDPTPEDSKPFTEISAAVKERYLIF
jgi:hypothetical protein